MQGLTSFIEYSSFGGFYPSSGDRQKSQPCTFDAIVFCAVAGCMPLVVCGGRSTAKKSNLTACEFENNDVCMILLRKFSVVIKISDLTSTVCCSFPCAKQRCCGLFSVHSPVPRQCKNCEGKISIKESVPEYYHMITLW